MGPCFRLFERIIESVDFLFSLTEMFLLSQVFDGTLATRVSMFHLSTHKFGKKQNRLNLIQEVKDLTFI